MTERPTKESGSYLGLMREMADAVDRDRGHDKSMLTGMIRDAADEIRELRAERDALREALLALVDVQPYLHPNRTKALKWEDKRQAALDLAAAALEGHP